ncbi:MAG: flagellar filament capping protein FliD [Oscillospiraceae bacterium]|nr:flagellar filament capping protein FliD [Oscillospiraceae bacterium]
MSTIRETNRMAGLMSGLDTEELVKAMSANTKARLNSQKQKLQKLEWKQESYRSIISKVSEFKNKYLDILSADSIKANAVMKKCTATSSNDKVITATASAGATAAKYTISKATAAKSASFDSNGAVSEGAVKLDFSNAEAGKSYTVELNFDGVTKNISFTAGADVEATKANFLNSANSAVADIKNSAQGFEFKDGTSTLVFNGNNDGVYHTFGVGASKAVGLDFSASSKITTSTKLGSVDFSETLVAGSDGKYKFTINGTDFEVDGNTTIGDLINKVNTSDAGVKLSFSSVSQSFEIATKNTGASAEINMSQSSGNLLNSLFNIGSDKLSITNADKGKIEYTEVNNDFSTRITNDIANKMRYGFKTDDAESSKYTVNISIDGTEHELELDLSALTRKESTEDAYTDEEVTTALNDALKKAYNDKTGEELTGVEFGFTTVTDDKTQKSTYNLSIKSDSAVTFGENDFYIAKDTTNVETKKADASYLAAAGVSSMTFNVDGSEVTVNASSTEGIKMQDLVDAGIVTIDNAGNITAAADIDGVSDEAKSLLNDIFGKDTGIQGANDTDTITAYGSNSSITVSTDGENFVTYTSANNSFSFDGTNINLSNAKEFEALTEDEYITIDTAKDTSGVKDVIVKFIDDYNKLLDDLYGEVTTNRPKSSGSYYDPLTEEQKEEMSEDEIKNWNENAKKGLLYRDSSVQRFLSDFRGAMASAVDGMTLGAMGITLTDTWSDHGKLQIDESKLDNAIETYGDKIADFFTSENGLAAKLDNSIERAISTKTNKYGYLTSLAGMKNTKTDKDNQIYRQMESIQDLIDRLNDKYEKEQDSYWQRFTALEKYMGQAQQQQSYFMQGY